MQNLQSLFSEFKDVKEEDILDMMIFISNQSQFQEDTTQRLTNIVFNTLKKNNEDEWNRLTNEPATDKVAQIQWNPEVFINLWSQQYPQLNVRLPRLAPSSSRPLLALQSGTRAAAGALRHFSICVRLRFGF